MITVIKTNDSITPAIHNIMRAIGLAGRRLLLNTVANEIIRQTKSNFGGGSNTYKDADKRWAPYSRRYAKVKGKSQPDLVVSGELKNSIQKSSPRSNWIEVFTKNKYAAYQTLGTRKMPARSFWPAQLYSPSYTRLTRNSERDVVIEISKRITVLSGGALPRLGIQMTRMRPQYGNILSGPTGVAP
jgi:phage gpG-like protein